MPHRFPRALCLALAALCLALAGCGEEPVGFVDGGPLDATVGSDAMFPERPSLVDAGGVMDVRGRACTRSSQCDDGVECTMDFCADDGRCVSVADPGRCDDRVYCNGPETCDARRGCVRGTPVTCNDNYTCTIDRCDEETRECVHRPRDFDGDGDPDFRCTALDCDAGVPDPPCWRGGDCDDGNPRVNSRLPEICGDGIDNNCNGEVDSADRAGCSRPMYDRCDDALDVSAGGRFTVGLAGALGDYPSRCAGNTVPPRDAILRLRLDAPRDVSLTAEASGASVLVQLGTRCGELEGVRDCVLGYPTVYRTRALPAGEYFFQIATTSAVVGTGDVAVTVELGDPTPTPANDACAGAIDLVPGTAARGTLVDVADDVLTSCGGTSPDLVYRLTLTERRDVTLRASGARNDYLTLSLVDTCARSPTTLRCGNGGPAQLSLRNVAPGTYYVVVEGTRVQQFTLEAELAAPTTAVPGDACANPIVIAPNSTVMGTVNGAQGDVPISCYGGDSRDLVYRFTLDRTLDVNAVLRGGASDFFFMAVQRTCGSSTGEVACRYGTVGRLTARGLDPGDYFLVVRPLRGTDFTLTLAASPPLAPVMASGNDTCATAQAIPSGGGFYLGNTASLRRDYTAPCTLGTTSEDAVFRYRSDVRQRVQVSLEGSSFNTVVWMTQGPMCPGSSVPLTCYSGEGAAPAVFDTLLDPGEYWIYVSGFNAEARGAYSLSVLPLPM
ncbi:MAG: putative metal-binding motif-containing protein [Deltaproteobacteria bacterium]|nr:putative metal-binding motif-containing protein [Myxococcales bacterium]MDP3213085.1 putative metal-binding motif-containing protein [Deltaproteobacteria bacterium]